MDIGEVEVPESRPQLTLLEREVEGGMPDYFGPRKACITCGSLTNGLCDGCGFPSCDECRTYKGWEFYCVTCRQRDEGVLDQDVEGDDLDEEDYDLDKDGDGLDEDDDDLDDEDDDSDA